MKCSTFLNDVNEIGITLTISQKNCFVVLYAFLVGICFYGDIEKVNPQIIIYTHLICFSDYVFLFHFCMVNTVHLPF